MQPYPVPGVPEDLGKIARLDQNENCMGPSPATRKAVAIALEQSWLYPDTYATRLCRDLARLHHLDAENIICGRGAMELISLLSQVYLEPGVNAVVTSHGYLYFKTASILCGATIKVAQEVHWTVDIEKILSQVDDNTRIVFVANPGNPTGTYLDGSELHRLRDRLPDTALLVIDEAYAEFVDSKRYIPCFDLVEKGRTVVLRTLSKIYGLAGLRVGWGYFPPEVEKLCRIIMPPNAINGIGQEVARAAVADQDYIESACAEIVGIRNRFQDGLCDLGFAPVPSQTNFVLLPLKDSQSATDAAKMLHEHDIWVRAMGGYELPHCIRITVGVEEVMQSVLDLLGNWIQTRT